MPAYGRPMKPPTTGRHSSGMVRRRMVHHALDEADKRARAEARANLWWLLRFTAIVLVSGWSGIALLAWWMGS